jgi:hypothetical protein
MHGKADSGLVYCCCGAGYLPIPADLPQDIAIEGLHDEAMGFMAQDLAASTAGAYSDSLKYVVRFLLAFGLFAYLWKPHELVVCWMAAFFARSAAYKTVCNYLKGYRYYLKINGFSLAVWDAWVLLPRVLQGIRRVKGDATNPKQAITPEILLAVYKVLPSGQMFLAVWVAMLVGFYAFLRKSHLCMESVSLTWQAALLLRKHIELVPAKDCILVTVTCLKTVQFQQRTHVIVIQGLPGHLLDPYYWVQKYFELVPAEADKPAFGYVVDGVYTPLTYAKLLFVMKDMLAKAGYDPSKFAGHSLRRGGATFAYQCGVNPLFIRIQGDWNSDAWLLYIGLSVQQKREVTLSMQRGIMKLSGAC